MRVRFVGSPHLAEYHRPGKDELHFRQGETREVRDDIGAVLMRDFPGIFTVDIAEPIIDRQIKEPARRKRG